MGKLSVNDQVILGFVGYLVSVPNTYYNFWEERL